MEKPAPTLERIHDLIRRRWSPRAFAERRVDPEIVRALLEAARWAPSSYNEQPWAFLVATKDDPEAFERLLGCLVPFNQTWAKSAPILILSVARLDFARNGTPNRHAWHDVGQATAQLALQATAEGLAVHQMAGFDAEKAREVCSVPEGHEPVAMMAVGYPGEPDSLSGELRTKETAPRSRRDLSDIVYAGRWGEASPVVASPGSGRAGS